MISEPDRATACDKGGIVSQQSRRSNARCSVGRDSRCCDFGCWKPREPEGTRRHDKLGAFSPKLRESPVCMTTATGEPGVLAQYVAVFHWVYNLKAVTPGFLRTMLGVSKLTASVVTNRGP